MNTLNYRITFTEPVLDRLGKFCDKEFSTKWMSLIEAMGHKARKYNNAKLINRHAARPDDSHIWLDKN